jgi:hypothetical protein
MNRILFFAVLALAGSAQAQIFSQTDMINGAHNLGSGSLMEPGETAFGASAQTLFNNIVADDFTLTTAANLTHIRIFAYEGNAISPSIMSVNFAVKNSVRTELSAANILSIGWYNVGGQGVYRTVGDTATTSRRIQYVDLQFVQTLNAGTYVLSYQLQGASSGGNGPFVPLIPSSLATGGKNAQWAVGGTSFSPFRQGSGGADLPFAVYGSAVPVPEPASIFTISLGLATILRRSRRAGNVGGAD